VLHRLCHIALDDVVFLFANAFDQAAQEHFKCLFLTKCYTLTQPCAFEQYLKSVVIFGKAAVEFQVASECLKCIRNVGNTNHIEEIFATAIHVLSDCIASSYQDAFIKSLISELCQPVQIVEHFGDSLCAVAFLNKVTTKVPLFATCNELNQLLVNIWRRCGTFWGDRLLTNTQKSTLSKELNVLQSLFAAKNESIV